MEIILLSLTGKQALDHHNDGQKFKTHTTQSVLKLFGFNFPLLSLTLTWRSGRGAFAPKNEKMHLKSLSFVLSYDKWVGYRHEHLTRNKYNPI